MNIVRTIRPKQFVLPFALIVLLMITVGIASATPSRATTQVDVFNFGFNAANIIINVGDTVEWTNSDGFHNVAETNGVFRCANGCDSTGGNGGPAGAGWTASFTFDTAGTYNYVCEVHASMVGTITVSDTTAVSLVQTEAAPASTSILIVILAAVLAIVAGRSVWQHKG